MRDVNNGWLIRYIHSNTASAFFFLVSLFVSIFCFYLCVLFIISIVNPPVYSTPLDTNNSLLRKGEGNHGHTSNQKNPLDSLSDEDFSEWFRGFVDASKKKLVVWGTNLTSTVGEKFTRKELAMVKLAPYQYSVLIGLILSDGWLTFASKAHKNARLGFKQSLSNSAYVWFVFNILSHYCSSSPHLTSNNIVGNRNYCLQIFTRSMACMTELHYLFYQNGVKIIPHNIYDLLTPAALAHWIMGDGAAQAHGLIICTDSYSIVDVVRLINVLIIRYKLECTLRFHTPSQPRIYIRQRSMPLLINIVIPHMHSSMLYKLGEGCF